jgi:hypothetical protein
MLYLSLAEEENWYSGKRSGAQKIGVRPAPKHVSAEETLRPTS